VQQRVLSLDNGAYGQEPLRDGVERRGLLVCTTSDLLRAVTATTESTTSVSGRPLESKERRANPDVNRVMRCAVERMAPLARSFILVACQFLPGCGIADEVLLSFGVWFVGLWSFASATAKTRSWL
jgi:hypothetical protein